MTPLKAVLFDIDDTLFPTTEFARRARCNAVRAMIDAGLELPEERVIAELEEVIAEFTSNYEHHYDKLVRRLRLKGLTRRRTALIVAAGVAAYHDTKMREIAPFEDVPPLLADLCDAGVRLGVITHGWSVKQAEKLVRLGLVPFFEPDAIFISDEIGISKPNPKLYSVALEEMALAGPEAMYVGDSPEHDIAPPQSLGMVSVWASRAARKTLRETGIEPDHEVADFEALRTLLRDRYEVAV
ncbi:MAG: haloacid dehalogenase [Planctomycetes bacterium]|jgi:putative hydrolase of the HAD superfamily|nr:haloacid dehalogenase [Planctomycetota bacterium]MDP6409606.1 TIGR02253 family HAD-type hydrolase [Planctomycetota bacterium]